MILSACCSLTGLQRGRRPSSSESRAGHALPSARRPASTGPTTFVVGEPVYRGVGWTRTWRCFNGADDLRRRRARPWRSARCCAAVASTGPTTFGVGEGALRNVSSRDSNGLQRGRRPSSSERAPRASRPAGATRGFNGADDLRRRRAVSLEARAKPSASLQRGRRPSSSERWFRDVPEIEALAWLQRGRRPSSSERVEVLLRGCTHVTLQRGRRPSSSES